MREWWVIPLPAPVTTATRVRLVFTEGSSVRSGRLPVPRRLRPSIRDELWFKSMAGLSISELRARTGLTPSALRFYERKGLLRAAGRAYRVLQAHAQALAAAAKNTTQGTAPGPSGGGDKKAPG